MNHSKAVEWVERHCCEWGYYPDEGHDFLIVHDWKTVRSDNDDYKPTKQFLEALSEITGYNPEEHPLDDDFWGFSDEYSTCYHCCNVIRTSPDSYSWSPGFWLSPHDGYICGDCVRTDPDDYIEYLAEQTDTARGCYLVDPADHGFVKVLEGLVNGMHHGQADDPIAVQRWAKENGLTVLWTVRSGQFDAEFDGYFAWAECPFCDEYDEVWSNDDEGCPRCQQNDGNSHYPLTDQEKDIITDTLVDYAKDYGCIGRVTYLKSNFRESPDLATRMEAALKSLSKPYARIANDGSVREYDTIEEYMEDDKS